MITDKKTGIIYKVWKSGDPRAVFLLVHGLGAHTGRWGFLADYFLKKDISCYGIELRGFGETKGLRGHVDSFKTYLSDIRALYDIIVEGNKDKKVFVAGESVGAVIAFLAAAAAPGLFDGLVCISPAFANRLKASRLTYIKSLAPLIYNPLKQIRIPFDAKMCTRDADYQKVMDADPGEHRLATSKFLFNLIAAQIRSNIVKGRIRTPVLFLLSGNDRLVDPEAGKRIFNGLKAGDKTIIEYPDMYHALSIDLGREKVFEDMLKWVEKRL